MKEEMEFTIKDAVGGKFAHAQQEDEAQGDDVDGLWMEVTKVATGDGAVKVQMVVDGRVFEGTLFQVNIATRHAV
jgi:hypothetical protein